MSVVPVHVEYRNSAYFGSFKDYQRNGYGLLILDNSNIIFAKWSANSLHGPYVYIGDKIRAYGTFSNDKLDGFNIITSNTQPIQTIYGMFRNNKLYGNSVLVTGDEVMIGRYVNGDLSQISQRNHIRDKQVYQFLNSTFPNNLHTLDQHLVSFIKYAMNSINQSQQYSRYHPTVRTFNDGNKFYGYIDHQDINYQGKGRSYGFLMDGNTMISIGEHNDSGDLQGIGRLYTHDGIQDGMFRSGQLKGIGVHFIKNGNKYTLGQHDGQSLLEKGFGFPNRQISQIRKQFHLRSIYFYNDIVMIGISAQLQNVLSNAFESQSRNNQGNYSSYNEPSPRFSSIKGVSQPYLAPKLPQKSPLRAKLTKYERQSQKIQDHSPIRNKQFNQYEPIDKRALKYFSLEDNQYSDDYIEKKDKKQYPINRQKQYPNTRQKSKTNYSRQKYKDKSQQKYYPRQQQYHIQEDQQVTPINRRLKYTQNKNNKGYQNKTQLRDRSDSRFKKHSGNIKDTQQLVRQLAQKQQKKRLDLDKIYKEARLYSKKGY